MTNACATEARFETALAEFVGKVEGMINAHVERSFKRELHAIERCRIKLMTGPKYIRVVQERAGGAGRQVYCFVEKSTGNILKPASWKAPAKHARGSIYAENPLAWCGPYGVHSIAR